MHPAPVVDVWQSADAAAADAPVGDCMPLMDPSEAAGQGHTGEAKDSTLQLIQEQPGA